MKSCSYTVVYTNGRMVPGSTTLDDDEKKAWAKLRQIILGVIGEDSDLEHVRVWHNGEYRDMFVDEIGAMKNLPVNANATALYHANLKEHDPDSADAQKMPPIHGNAVLFHQQVWK